MFLLRDTKSKSNRKRVAGVISQWLRVPLGTCSFMRHKGNAWVSGNSWTYTRDYFHTLFYIVYIPHLNDILIFLSHCNHWGLCLTRMWSRWWRSAPLYINIYKNSSRTRKCHAVRWPSSASFDASASVPWLSKYFAQNFMLHSEFSKTITGHI